MAEASRCCCDDFCFGALGGWGDDAAMFGAGEDDDEDAVMTSMTLPEAADDEAPPFTSDLSSLSSL